MVFAYVISCNNCFVVSKQMSSCQLKEYFNEIHSDFMLDDKRDDVEISE